MRAEIISTGTELLLGQIVDTNARFLAEKLAELGMDLFFQSTVGDNQARIAETLQHALDRADLVIMTGGLGPTSDDLSREAVAEAMNLELRLDENALEELKAFFHARGREMPEMNIKQALFPAGARIIPNPRGTAPGFIVEQNDKMICVLPGPPREMMPMFVERIVPFLKGKAGNTGRHIVSRVFRLVGIGESSVEEAVKDMVENQSNPTIGFLAPGGEVLIRLTVKADSLEKAEAILAEPEKEIKERLGSYIYGTDADTLEKVVAQQLMEKGLTFATAESCTGGLIAKRLTEIPGISSSFLAGIVSYSNEAKMKLLGVSETTLAQFGAVSAETAVEMAAGARNVAGSDLAISVTGIAGPGGGTPEKPVGLVYIGFADQKAAKAYRYIFSGDREGIRLQTANTALNLVRKYLDTSSM